MAPPELEVQVTAWGCHRGFCSRTTGHRGLADALGAYGLYLLLVFDLSISNYTPLDFYTIYLFSVHCFTAVLAH